MPSRRSTAACGVRCGSNSLSFFRTASLVGSSTQSSRRKTTIGSMTRTGLGRPVRAPKPICDFPDFRSQIFVGLYVH